MVTNEISKDVKMRKEKKLTRDISLNFSHACMGNKTVSFTVTSSGCIIVHSANEIFLQKELVVKTEEITSESGTIYNEITLK
jgi:hypothetical protein